MCHGSNDETQFDMHYWRSKAASFGSPKGVQYTLVKQLAANRYRQVWSAKSDSFPRRLLVAEFVAEMPTRVESRDPSAERPRGVIELSTPLGTPDERRPAAIVTLLPAVLPYLCDRFTLRRFIGMGGMGQVWQAESPEYPGVRLAIKFMTLPDGPLTPVAMAQFRKEVEMGSEIEHSYILHTRQFLDLSGHIADGWPPCGLAMKYLPVSLDRVLDDCRKPDRQVPQKVAIQWCGNLVDALGELHDFQGRVQRDLKPANVMIELRKGCVYRSAESLPDKLIGSRAVLSDLGTVCCIGKPPLFLLKQDGWEAPELFEEPDYKPAPAEDVYSLGKVLAAMVEHVEGSPEWLKESAHKCVHRNPAERPTLRSLLEMVSPDRDVQLRLLSASGYHPEQHEDFVGRRFVFEAFDRYRQKCGPQGGMFLIEGDEGVGKTALLTNWAKRAGAHIFYRYGEDRTRPSAMPEALIEMLARRYGLSQGPVARKQEYAARLYEVLKSISDSKLKPEETLLIMVDALDEAQPPTEAAQMLPKPPLPRRVFLIVSSQPPKTDVDYLSILHPAERYRLCGTDPENLKDGAEFVKAKLGHQLASGEAEALAESAGGCFQLLRHWVTEIEAGEMSVREALDQPAGLFHWYQRSWDKSTREFDARSEEIKLLVRFACLMAALEAPIAEREVGAILGGWDDTTVDWARKRLGWTLTYREERVNGYPEGSVYLRHKTVRDFLVSTKPGSLGPAHAGVRAMHAQIGRYYLGEASEKGWNRVHPYGQFHAVRHLVRSGEAEAVVEALECLQDLRYLQGTLGEGS